MKTKSQAMLCSFIVILFSIPAFSQSPYIYDLPATAHGLKLKAKGDLSFSLGTTSIETSSNFSGTSSVGSPQNYSYFYKINSTNLQFGYTFLDRLSLSLFHDRTKTTNQNKKHPIAKFHTSYLTGIGIGTYHNFKLKNKSKLSKDNRNVLVDFHLGYGRGKIENQYFIYDLGDILLNIQKIYLQGGIHYIGKHLDYSYMLKFGKVNYLNGIINGKIDTSDSQTISSIINVSDFTIWENTLKIELKISNFGIFYQWSHTSNYEFSEPQWVSTLSSFGLAVRLNTVKKKTKKD